MLGDIYNLGFGTLSLDGIYSYVRDAVALGLTGGTTNASGMPIAPFPEQTLTATISNNQSVMLLAKYTVGGLRLYAGYEWVQFAPPSDPQTAFTNIAGLPMGAAFGNGTAIDNVAFSAGCAAATVCSDKILQIVWTGAKCQEVRCIYRLHVLASEWRFVERLPRAQQLRSHGRPALPLLKNGGWQSIRSRRQRLCVSPRPEHDPKNSHPRT